ncbi:MAG TPA: hypothetical protein PKY78_00315 [Candidatus Omnitrophota bacterium]|nr:hypothetical protein [Candidatus Omnitrophota bacterium]
MRGHVRVILLFAAYFLIFFISTKFLFSGFHLYDYPKFGFVESLNKKGLVKTIDERIGITLKARFVPMREIDMTLRSWFFGLVPYRYYLYMCFLLVLCSFLLYRFAETIGFTRWQSVFFALFTLTGQQAECWWWMGTAELMGMVFLSIAFYALAMAARTRQKMLFDMIFMVGLIGGSFSKESFIIVIPAVLFLKIWIDAYLNEKSFLKAFFGNILPVILMMSLMVWEVTYILRHIGTKSELLATVNIEVGTGVVKTLINMLRNFNLSFFVLLETVTFFVIIFGCFLILQASYDGHRLWHDAKRKVMPLILFFLLFVVPQFIMYSGTGIRQRWWLPAFLAFSFAVTYLLREIIVNRGINKFTKVLFIMLVVMVALPRLGHAYFRGSIVAERGLQNNAMIAAITAHTSVDSNIVIVGDPVMNAEAMGGGVPAFLKNIAHRDNCYFILIDTGRIFHTAEITECLRRNSKTELKNRDITNDVPQGFQTDSVFVFPYIEDAFLRVSSGWFHKEEYERVVFKHFDGDFVCYFKK